jgi:8-oxo-(d)GTP phosphatase
MKYSVYYEPRMLQFISPKEEIVGLPAISLDTTAPGELWQFFSRWAGDSGSGDAALISRDPSRLFRAFASHFELVEAAGGLVTCPSGEVLMIYRNGFWDLPKGKLYEGERAEEAGIREVEEECAVNGLTIKGTLPTSFHVYTLKGERWMLKKTQWFYMHAETKQIPRPQLDEQITRAEWISPARMKPLLTKSYRSVADLIRLYIDLYV